MVGQTMQNTLTGQNNGETVSSYTPGSGSFQGNQNSSANEVVSCDYTLSTGAHYPATVTLFANGSAGATYGG